MLIFFLLPGPFENDVKVSVAGFLGLRARLPSGKFANEEPVACQDLKTEPQAQAPNLRFDGSSIIFIMSVLPSNLQSVKM